MAALQCFGDWTLILFADGSPNFDRPYSDYINGFGTTADGNYWLGNQVLSYLTSSRVYNLRVDLWLTDGTYMYTEFKQLWVLDSTNGFQIRLGEFLGGTAGDGGLVSGRTFHAKDLDNMAKCAAELGAGWWYGNQTLQECNKSMLTGNVTSPASGFRINWTPGAVGSNLGLPFSIVQAAMRIRSDLILSAGIFQGIHNLYYVYIVSTTYLSFNKKALKYFKNKHIMTSM